MAQQQAAVSLSQAMDDAGLTPRYWIVFTMLSVLGVFEVFDMFVVGFIVAQLSAEWQLTYGQAAVMLLSGGVGSIAGALSAGFLADRFGRKAVFLGTAVLCGSGSLLLAAVSDGDWVAFCILRLVIGFGGAGAATVQAAMLVEFTPTRWRGLFPGLAGTLASLGVFAAAVSSAALMEQIGWRGLAFLGAAPLPLALVGAVFVPESVRWLLSRGRNDEALAAAQKMTGMDFAHAENPGQVTGDTRNEHGRSASLQHRGRFAVLFASWLCLSTAGNGIYLWGPSVLALLLGISVQASAGMFIFVSLGGLTGKLMSSLSPGIIGRRRTAQFAGFGGAAALASSALFPLEYVQGVPIFLLGLIVGAFFLEGSYANMAPYSAELLPVRLSARAAGVAQAGNGVGKIVGPVALALVAGASNALNPQATAEAATPGFLTLAAFAFVLGLIFTFFRAETQGKPLQV